MSREDVLKAVAEAGLRVAKLDALRKKLVTQRDASAWSLHIHGEDGEAWSNPRVRAIFGRSSHNAWTKSRKRMVETYPDGKPNQIREASARLSLAASRIQAVDDALAIAQKGRAAAYAAALEADPSITYADLAEAAGRTRQAVWAELGKQNTTAE